MGRLPDEDLDYLSSLDGAALASARRHLMDRDDPVISRLDRIEHNIRDIGRAVLVVAFGVVALLLLAVLS
jgi:hypothetical protein